MKIRDVISSRLWLIFPKISGNIKFPENLQPYMYVTGWFRFTQSSALRNHKRTHSSQRPYKCSVCAKEFAQQRLLALHMRTHTDDRPFECAVCPMEFGRSDALKVDMRTHTGERPYSCEVCRQRFTTSGSVKRHMRTHTTNWSIRVAVGMQWVHFLAQFRGLKLQVQPRGGLEA